MKSIQILKEKAKYWTNLANHCLGQGRQEEASEYHIRAKMLYEAANIVEDCERDDT